MTKGAAQFSNMVYHESDSKWQPALRALINITAKLQRRAAKKALLQSEVRKLMLRSQVTCHSSHKASEKVAPFGPQIHALSKTMHCFNT